MGCNESRERHSSVPGHGRAGDSRKTSPTYKVVGAAEPDVSQAQLRVVMLKGAPGKARWDLGEEILSSGPDPNIQPLGVSRVVKLKCPGSNSKRLFSHHIVRQLMLIFPWAVSM